ncbi:uncharacterized protein LOC132202026 isoform X3 [Neocloeon triangulifer]|uniref:uncharacterized protein LOC132202026 isoform X3 n=1 Tax=Neocloeon triangulifer TaxID=2078957 RepID=UPI00286F778C|nr:uncharacterized protein LOC132202026 isoform X3 [Neocloeon triangulifer]
MLKWAVGVGEHAAVPPPSSGPPEAVAPPEITETPTSRPKRSLRRASERFHVLPACEMQVKRAIVRTIYKDGKENSSAERVDDNKQATGGLLQKLRAFGPLANQLEMEQRGPLGDVTNQSPVTSPRAPTTERKATPARSRSRRTMTKGKTAANAENDGDPMRPKCTSCHSTPKRRLPKRTPKRKKAAEPQFNLSPLKPSDLCIDYSPDLGDSLLALRKRLEESLAPAATTVTTQVDNPLYFNLQPSSISTVSPISRQISRLRIISHDESPPPLPAKPPPAKVDTNENTLVSQFMATLKDINLSSPLETTITNDPSPSTSSCSGGSRKRARRHSEGQTPVATSQRQRRYSDNSTISARSSSINTEPDTTLKATEASIALTLPTPRLTPELNCWRNSVAYSEVSALNETWDSHRLHTLLRQQDKALAADQDTPPFEIRMETKSIAALASMEPFTPLSATCEATIQQARIVDLTSLTSRNATTSGVDIIALVDSVLREHIKEEDEVYQTPVASFEGQESKDSPVALVDRQSRSRRCLAYVSPSSRQRSALNLTPCRKKRKRPKTKGELKLSLYKNAGLLTVHVISATNLPQRDPGKPASAFVKICVLPKKGCDGGPIGETQRTNVRRPASGPAGCPIYRFDQKFSLEFDPEEKVANECRVLVSVWLRPRAEKHRKSECVGCMSFGVDDVFKQDVRGSFLVLSPSTGRSQNVAVSKSSGQLPGAKNITEMAEHASDSSIDDARENDGVTPRRHDKRRSGCRKAFSTPSTQTEDNTFLCHLELEPPPEEGHRPSSASGRTPFTHTRKLVRKSGSGFGFSVAWTQPPRVERVEAGLPADKAGMRPGDYIIFVENQNVVTMPEDAILNLIRLSGNNLTLEVYRRTTPNGVVLQQTTTAPAPMPPPATRRSASVTDCSATTSDLRRRLQLPQVTFSTEAVLSADEARKRAVYQLLQRLQNFALSMRFGVDRFLVPLADRKDLLSSQDHFTLFQNSEELVMLTEEMLDQLVTEDTEAIGQNLGKVYVNKVQALTNAYRKYCLGLKRADCLLAQQTSNPGFLKVVSDPPIPKRRPDLTTFLHKPLEHYRETLKLLQTVLKNSKVNDEEYAALSKVVQAFETTYKDITANSGLMEPDSEGKPLLSIQDLESRLVFTKCKPFKLNTGGRQWIFGGDLSRIEGRSSKAFWALLFSDLLLLATVSRDKVLFVTDEPLSLLAVTQACFTIKKKENEFRLIVDAPPHSPLDANAKKDKSGKTRRKSIAFRAPTPELKAVWQNLIQRQIIYLNTVRGGTPNASPLDSPAEQPSIATVDSPSRLQGASQKHLDQIIEQKCRLLGKTGINKGSILHLQQWMTGQLGTHQTDSPITPEAEFEIWSPATLRKRGMKLLGGGPHGRAESRCSELEMSSPDPDRSPSHSTEGSQVTVKSGGIAVVKLVPKQTTEQAKKSFFADMGTAAKAQEERSPMLSGSPSVFRQDLYKKLPALSSPIFSYKPSSPGGTMQNGSSLPSNNNPSTSNVNKNKVRLDSTSSEYDSEEGDKWEPLPSEMGITLQNIRDHDEATRVPMIAIVPPTPSDASVAGDTEKQTEFEWETAANMVADACNDDDEDDSDDEDQPFARTLSNSACVNVERAGARPGSPVPSLGSNKSASPTMAPKPFTFNTEKYDLKDLEEDDRDSSASEDEEHNLALEHDNLRKFGTLQSLENLHTSNQDGILPSANADDLSDSGEEEIQFTREQIRYDRNTSAAPSTVQNSPTTAKKVLVSIEDMKSKSIKGWGVHSGPSVAEKTKMFEELKTKENAAPIDRFMPNPLTSGAPPTVGTSIPRTISSSCSIPGNTTLPTPASAPKTPSPSPTTPMKIAPKTIPKEQPRTVAQLKKVGPNAFQNKSVLPKSPPTSQPVARHTVVMGTTATLKTKAPAVPVRAKIYSSFNKKAPAPQPPTGPAKSLELKSTSTTKPAAPMPPAASSQAKAVLSNAAVSSKPATTALSTSPPVGITNPPATSAAAAAAIAAANQIGSPDSSVSDKEEWGTPEDKKKAGADPEDTEEELSSSQDIVSLFPCVGSEHQGGGQRSWSPDDDDQLTRLLAAPPRVYPRRRLEPLYEEEDGAETRPRPRLLSDSSSSGGSSPEQGKAPPPPRRGCLVKPGQGSWADAFPDTGSPTHSPQGKQPPSGCGVGTNGPGTSGSSGLLRRLRLASSRRRDFPGVESPRQERSQTSKLLRPLGGILGGSRSEDNKAGGLLRLFSNNNNNNSTTTTNTAAGNNNNNNGPNKSPVKETVPLDYQDEKLDRRFWKQLKRRRSSLNSSTASPIALTGSIIEQET